MKTHNTDPEWMLIEKREIRRRDAQRRRRAAKRQALAFGEGSWLEAVQYWSRLSHASQVGAKVALH